MKFRKLSNNAMTVVITLVIVIISIFTFIVISFSMKSIYLKALADMTNVAQHNIFEHIQLHKNETALITKLQSFTNMMVAIKENKTNTDEYDQAFSQTFAYIVQKTENTASIEKITVTDKSRKILVSSEAQEIGKTIATDSYYWTDINNNISTASIQKNETDHQIVLISHPIRLYNKTVGYIFMETNFDIFDSLINNYRFGESGNLFFITENGDFISSDSEIVASALSDIADGYNIVTLLQKNQNTANKIYNTDLTNNACNRYMVYTYIDSLNAVIATSVNKYEVNKTSITTAIPLFLLLLIILILLLAYRVTIEKKIIHPLNLLNRSLYLLKKGDLRARYNYNANNEFGNLSMVFNQTISNLQKTTLELKERETKNNIILQNVTDVIWEYDVESGMIKMPENWAKLVQLEQWSISHEYSLEYFLEFIHPIFREDFRLKLHQCASNHQNFTFDCQIKKQNNEYLWVKINGACLYNLYNEPHKIIGSLFNINDIKLREDNLKEVAKHDDMTKLLKKGEIKQIINLCLSDETNHEHTLFMIDLDEFKHINDTFGHLIGDEAILHAAVSLKSIFSDSCYTSRFGGDEFVAFSKEKMTPKKATELATKMIQKLNKGFITSNNQHIILGCSIGIAFSPEHGSNYEALMENADFAIYQAKKTNKNQYIIFKATTEK